jgi:5-methyltetrahydrofolate corrinoid/iron sulfur protein methyltransferase
MIIAADNLTSANPVVAQALRDLNPRPLQDLAVRCAEAGAHLLDLNPGYLSRRHEDRMARVLAGGLAACRDKPILNAVTLEEEKLEEILPLAAAHQTQLVLLLLDEKSHPPPTLEGKVALAVELRERCLAAGLTDEQLIFDPVLPNLRWPDAWPQTGADFKTVRYLASGSLFGVPVSTMVGLSNLRSGLRDMYPVQLDITVLALLAGAGLSLALVDVLNPELREQVQLLYQIMDNE